MRRRLVKKMSETKTKDLHFKSESISLAALLAQNIPNLYLGPF